MKRRRVAVTGIGLVTPLGTNRQTTWENAIAGKSGVQRITRFDAQPFPVQIAAEVKEFKPELRLNGKELRKMGLFIQYGLIAAYEALEDAKLPLNFESESSPYLPSSVGVNISAGLGGLPEVQHWDRELFTKEKKVVSPFFVPMIIPNLISGHLSIITRAQGPNLCYSTACASSSHSVGEGARIIQNGTADVMIVGGAEAVICELGIAGFASMRALSTRNNAPEEASRPYDQERDGFVLGEGAGVLILEDWDKATQRNARIYAEIVGYGANADAYHMTTPAPEGRGARICMQRSLEDAGVDPELVDYVNSHGTSTPAGDAEEAQAIAQVFQKNVLSLHVSSTKSMTGHLLGAAGGLEAALTVLALHHSIIPPTINLKNLDLACAKTQLNFTPNSSVKKQIRYALSNSFGFGGTNASLLFKNPTYA